MNKISYKKILAIFLLFLITNQLQATERLKINSDYKELFLPNNGLVYLLNLNNEETLFIPNKSENNAGISDNIADYSEFLITPSILNSTNSNLKEFNIKNIKNDNNSYIEEESCKKIKFIENDRNFKLINYPKKLSGVLTCKFSVSNENNQYFFKIQFNYPFNRWIEIAKNSTYQLSSHRTAILISEIENKSAKIIHLKPSPNSIVYTEFLDLSSIYNTSIFPNAEKIIIEGFRIDQLNKNAFLFPDGKYIKEIVYSSNILPIIKNEYFSKLENIETINLVGNKISVIEDFAFHGLKNIKDIRLEYNPELFYKEYSKDRKFQFLCNLYSLKNYEILYKKNCDIKSEHNPLYSYNKFSKELFINNQQFSKVNFKFLENFTQKSDIKKLTIFRGSLDFRNFKNDDLNLLYTLINLESISFIDTYIHSLREDSFKNLKLKKLSFDNNGIQYIEKNSFNNLNNIEEIEIKNNKNLVLSNLSLKNLNNLKKLSILNSNIETINEKTFDDLINIVEINLSNNKINDLSFINPSMLNLKYLNLSRNKIIKVKNLHDLNSLVKLDLSHNEINEVNSNFFYRNPNLNKIDLSFNKINYLPSYAFYYSDTIVHLNLNNNPIVKLDHLAFYNLKNLTELLMHNTNLKNLEFNVFNENYLPKLVILNLKNKAFLLKYNLKNAFGGNCRNNVNFEKYYFSCTD
nr:hypothetical protein GTC16762_04180 [Pigmentibacter ruber]